MNTDEIIDYVYQHDSHKYVFCYNRQMLEDILKKQAEQIFKELEANIHTITKLRKVNIDTFELDRKKYNELKNNWVK